MKLAVLSSLTAVSCGETLSTFQGDHCVALSLPRSEIPALLTCWGWATSFRCLLPAVLRARLELRLGFALLPQLVQYLVIVLTFNVPF